MAAVLGAVVRVLIEHGVLTDAGGGSNSITSIKPGVPATVSRTYYATVVKSLISDENVWITSKYIHQQKGELYSLAEMGKWSKEKETVQQKEERWKDWWI